MEKMPGEKIQHSFMIKALKNLIKAIYDKCVANIVLTGENQNVSDVRNETRLSTLSTPIQ
jgi:hypothetical protein